MNDALMEKLHGLGLDLDLAPMLPGFIALAAVLAGFVIVRKVFRKLLILGRRRSPSAGGWVSYDPELDQLFQIAAATGQLVHDEPAELKSDDGDNGDSLPKGCYVLRLRGRQRACVRALMSTIDASRNGWRYLPGDNNDQSVLSGPLFSIKV